MKKINLHLGEKDNSYRPVALIVFILTALAIFIITSLSSSSVVSFILTGTSLHSSDGKVNVLLLGMAGGRHQGATLTDTIIVASYDLGTKKVYLISIPRDLWLPSLQSKANAVYQMGLAEGNGLGFAKTVVGNILGLPIHYVLRVDFSGFIGAIDILGGIDILVERSFDDYNYPIEGKENDLCSWEEKEIEFSEEEAKKLNIEKGIRKVLVDKEGKIATDSAEPERGFEYFPCRYEHISFRAGLTHMNGETALKFVRSRMGTNNEGSDFSRSKRQQKVMDAAKDKILSLETLTDASKISELIKTLGKSIDTDITVRDALEFYNLGRKLQSTHSFALDDKLLFHPPAKDYGGAYVLISQDDDFSNVHKYVRKILDGEITEYEATTSARPGN